MRTECARSLAAAALAMFLAAPAVSAVPVEQAPVAGDQAAEAVMDFDPPLDTPLRYRWEKTVTEDGKTEIEWEVTSYTFRPTEQGFNLTIQPMDSGSNETDPMLLAAEAKLKDLLDKPFILRLSEDGNILSVEDADLFWNRVFDAVEEAIAETGNDGKPLSPDEREFMGRFLQIMRDMPAETRLAVMMESVRPALEFAMTEMTTEPVITTGEAHSPFGGSVEQAMRIGLEGLDGDSALLTVRTSLSEPGLRKLTHALAERLTALADGSVDEAEREELAKVMADVKIRHDTVARYRVSTTSGLTEDFTSTETLDVSGGGVAKHKVTMRSLKRVE